MSVCWEFVSRVTPTLTHARILLLGTELGGRMAEG